MNPILRMAILGGSTASVRLILKAPIDLDARDSKGRTALIYAASLGHQEICLALLQKGASPRALDSYGDDARVIALRNGHKDVAREIVNYLTASSAVVPIESPSSEQEKEPFNEPADVDELSSNPASIAATASQESFDQPATLVHVETKNLSDAGATVQDHPSATAAIIESMPVPFRNGNFEREIGAQFSESGLDAFTCDQIEEDTNLDNEGEVFPYEEDWELDRPLGEHSGARILGQETGEGLGEEDDDWDLGDGWDADPTGELHVEDDEALRHRLTQAQATSARFVPLSGGTDWEDIEIEFPGETIHELIHLCDAVFFDDLRGLIRHGLEFGAIAYTELAFLVEEAWENDPDLQDFQGGERWLLDALLDSLGMIGLRVDHSPLAPWSWHVQEYELTVSEDIAERTEAALCYLRECLEPADPRTEVFYGNSYWHRPRLKKNEERLLAIKFQKSNEALRGHISRKLFHANVDVVRKIAVQMNGGQLPLDDRIQEGALGLIRAIEKFDPSTARLRTYAAWWVRQRISRAFADQSRLIRIPVHMGDTLRQLKNLSSRLELEYGGEVPDDVLAREFEVSIGRLADLKRYSLLPLSLEQSPPGEYGREYWDEIISDISPCIEDDVYHKMISEEISGILDRLSERERDVLLMRIGLFDGKEHTLEEIGRIWGVTRERIRQIESKAIVKLKKPAYKVRMERVLRF